MKTTCIIDCYNHESFVVEAVNSLKNQTVKFAEIIIVDDCSTDNSAKVLKDKYANDDQITLILKDKNQGQLAAFNDAFLASTGDVIFFLDSDDLYQPTYLEEALNVYETNKDCDFIFCQPERTGELAPDVKPSKIKSSVYDYGYSAASVFYLRRWVGDATSTLSMRRRILSKILPLPYIEEWITRADDCLVYGASIAGARKFFLNKPLVQYRFHGNNTVFTFNFDGSHYLYKRELSLDRLFSLMYQRMGYKMDLAELAVMEFKTLQSPNLEDLDVYLKIVRLSKMSLFRKLKHMADILLYFRSFNKNPQPEATLETKPEVAMG
ncbi:MAG: glycosyltransferase family 2 protein [Potamolinea sp.]